MKLIASILTSLMLSTPSLASSALVEPEFDQHDTRHWVVMVTQEGCSFCVRLEEEILQPLRETGEFTEKVRFTFVDIGFPVPLNDFDGSPTTTTRFASRYKGFGTPTLLFLSHTGKVLAPAKFGVPDIIDFYAYEVEETIRNLP